MTDIILTLRSLPDFYAANGVSEEQIAEAEQRLNLRFAPDYRLYLKELGLACGDGHELTGICSSKRLNVEDVTLSNKLAMPDIPSDWYVLEEANIDGIVIWQTADGKIYQSMPNAQPVKLCDSICEHLHL